MAERHAEFGHPSFVGASFVSPITDQVASNARSIEASTMGSAQLDGVSRVPMSSSLCIRRESCALSAPRACYRHAGDGRVCAFAKASESRKCRSRPRPCRGRIDQALQGNKIDPTREHPCRSGRFLRVSLGRALAARLPPFAVGFRPAENAKWGALA